MHFYDMLQLDPAVLKPKIRNAETTRERRMLQTAVVLRSILIVAFAIAFIATLSNVFGSENSPMAVALFCILLGIRFVDFGYCIADSMRNLAIVFSLLLITPVLTSIVNPLFAICIHVASFLTILMMTCDEPALGNAGLYGFAYVYLTGNPVTGELLWKRFLLTMVGYILCGSILYFKHRKKHTDVRFHQVLGKFSLSSEKSRWQLRVALGTGLILTLGNALQVERFMWAGFACASLLSTYPAAVDVKERVFHRILGVIVGSLLFFVIYQVTPDSLHTLLGPFGGFCMGFCTDYRYKTAINCLGALLLASNLYGVGGAVILRILNNMVGAVFGYSFFVLYQKLVDNRFAENVGNAQEPIS